MLGRDLFCTETTRCHTALSGVNVPNNSAVARIIYITPTGDQRRRLQTAAGWFTINPSMKILLVVPVVMTVFGVAGYFAWQQKIETDRLAGVFDYTSCAAAGYPVSDSYPAKCETPDGQLFTEERTVARTADILNVQEVPPTKYNLFTAKFVRFEYPTTWNPVNLTDLPPGTVQEAIRLGIPGNVSDQMMSFTELPFASIQPNDVLTETPIDISGKSGKKWVRTGDGYTAYDYYTEAPGNGSFGIHVTLAEADPTIEADLDHVVRTLQFQVPAE